MDAREASARLVRHSPAGGGGRVPPEGGIKGHYQAYKRFRPQGGVATTRLQALSKFLTNLVQNDTRRPRLVPKTGS